MTHQEALSSQVSRCESGESDTVDETVNQPTEDASAGASGCPEHMYVLDPEGRNTGVYGILIPVDAIVETRALRRHRRTSNPPPSLCLLFQAGRCRASTHCQQVHVPAEKVIEVRARSATGSTCCLEHGDVHSVMSDMAQWDIPVVRMTADETVEVNVPLHSLARTATLERLKKRAKGAVPTFGVTQVCRLHQRGGCSYGKECRHVHLCREFMRKWEAERQAAAPVEAKPAVTEPNTVEASKEGAKEKQAEANGAKVDRVPSPNRAAAVVAAPNENEKPALLVTVTTEKSGTHSNGSKAPAANRPKPQVQVHATQPVPSITPKTALRTFATTFTSPGEPPTQSPTAPNIAALLKNLHFDPSATSNFSPTNLTKGVTFQAAANAEQPLGAGKTEKKASSRQRALTGNMGTEELMPGSLVAAPHAEKNRC